LVISFIAFSVFIPHPVNFTSYFLTEPLRFEHFNILTLPEQFLNKVESRANEHGEDAENVIALNLLL
jgi:hypothetical protein